MRTNQFTSLIQAATGRPLTFDADSEEIQLDSKIIVLRPYHWKDQETTRAFEWKTPKKEDSLLRSFITAFCSKYQEPDPKTYSRNDLVYGDTWARHDEAWKNPATHWNCSPWNHHRDHQTSKDNLKKQVIANFSNFDCGMARLGFYPTLYGIGIFTIYGGEWVRNALNDMTNHLKSKGIPYRNEMSDAGWVTRFVMNLDKQVHSEILGDFQ